MELTYQDIMRETFEDRKRANPAYSLRSFARDLDLAPSTLSEVFKGKKGLSLKNAISITKTIRLPEWQATLFCDSVERQHAKSPRARDLATRRLRSKAKSNRIQVLRSLAIQSLTSWEDLAILEAIHLEDFEPSTPWLAKRLGLSVEHIEASVARLKVAGLLACEKDGRWIDVSPRFSTSDGIPSESVQRFHHSVLDLIGKKILSEPIENRTSKTAIFALSKSKWGMAKKIMDQTLAQLGALTEQDDTSQGPDDICCFNLNLISLTKKEEK